MPPQPTEASVILRPVSLPVNAVFGATSTAPNVAPTERKPSPARKLRRLRVRMFVFMFMFCLSFWICSVCSDLKSDLDNRIGRPIGGRSGAGRGHERQVTAGGEPRDADKDPQSRASGSFDATVPSRSSAAHTVTDATTAADSSENKIIFITGSPPAGPVPASPGVDQPGVDPLAARRRKVGSRGFHGSGTHTRRDGGTENGEDGDSDHGPERPAVVRRAARRDPAHGARGGAGAEGAERLASGGTSPRSASGSTRGTATGPSLSGGCSPSSSWR